jgi:outer membrane protein OmpA-like peptidoglycan-associated protein
MAILRLVVVLLLATSILPGCGSLPEATQTSVPREGIAWIDRQFKTCSGKDCPTPTRKTLAMVELFIAKKEPAPPIAKAPETVVPVVRHDEPVTATVLFEFGKSAPSADGQQALKRLTTIAANFQRIEIEGRTDDIGSKAYNDRLARRRAEVVRSWLIKQGINAEIVVRAEGLCCYLDTALTETARRNNRRVEVRLVNRQDAVSNSKGAQ